MKKLILCLLTIFSISIAYLHFGGFLFNVTESIPVGLYKKIDKKIERGSVVAYCLDEKTSKFALERGYIISGECPNQTGYMFKVVEGVPGDKVLVNENGVYINGDFIPGSAPQQKDSKGNVMPDININKELELGEYVLMSGHKYGFDARYIGLTYETQIVSVIKQVF